MVACVPVGTEGWRECFASGPGLPRQGQLFRGMDSAAASSPKQQHSRAWPGPAPCLPARVLALRVPQVLPAALSAAADADATAFVITTGPSARTGTKSSAGGGGLFAFGGGGKGGAQGADRVVALAEKAGVGSYFVIRGAGLTSTSPASAAPGLVVAEAGSVDSALAGQVCLSTKGVFLSLNRISVLDCSWHQGAW